MDIVRDALVVNGCSQGKDRPRLAVGLKPQDLAIVGYNTQSLPYARCIVPVYRSPVQQDPAGPAGVLIIESAD